MEIREQQKKLAKIQTLIDLETHAWNTQNAGLLVSLFHPDMVWPWPPDNQAHNPGLWIFPQGRYDKNRWQQGWQKLFDSCDLVHNQRKTVKIMISQEGDGAFAVVDVDTLWQDKKSKTQFHWQGRAGKGYTLTQSGWKLIFHTGLLSYGQ